MKISPFFYVMLATILLVLVTVMASLNFSFSWVFYATVFGQLVVLIMVYKILTDNYTTNKTFKDFYEDKPIKRENYRT